MDPIKLNAGRGHNDLEKTPMARFFKPPFFGRKWVTSPIFNGLA
jgi:hypothetical protein